MAWKIRTCNYAFDFKYIKKNSLVRGLSNFKFEKDKICDACQVDKQTKSSFKFKYVISTTRPLQLLHMNLFGPFKIASYGGNYYVFVIVDDFFEIYLGFDDKT